RASSPTVASPRASRASNARRVPSARAAKVRSRRRVLVSICLPIYRPRRSRQPGEGLRDRDNGGIMTVSPAPEVVVKPMLLTTTAAIAVALGGFVSAGSSHETTPTPPDVCAERLRTFDTLDFDVFSHQKWDRLGESHAQGIVVTWPDGHET